MKYSININQYAAVSSGLDLDIIDLAIFDFIKDFAASPKAQKLQTDSGIYIWVSHKMIIEEMPTLGIKSVSGMRKRLANLVNAGVLVLHPQCDMIGKSYYAFGAAAEQLMFASSTSEATPSFSGGGAPKSNDPVLKRTGPCPKKDGVPCPKKDGDNIYNIDNNNKDNILYSGEKEFSPTPQKTSSEKKTLFRNSEIGQSVVDDDYSAFIAAIGKDCDGIDLVYYYNVVRDWSDSSNTKRTNRGWIATIKTFMRKDMENGKLHRIQEAQTPTLSADELWYLNL